MADVKMGLHNVCNTTQQNSVLAGLDNPRSKAELVGRNGAQFATPPIVNCSVGVSPRNLGCYRKGLGGFIPTYTLQLFSLGFPEVEDPCSEAEGRKSWLLPQSGQETEEGVFKDFVL